MSRQPQTYTDRDRTMSRRLALEDERCPFGPSFFLSQLRAFIRDRCPDPSEALPSVQLHLAEGEVIDVCHLIGIAPAWVAVAAVENERATGAPFMRTEIIPYGLVSRVTVRAVRPHPGQVGFEATPNPEVLTVRGTPEDDFLAMAGQGRAPEGPARAGPGFATSGTGVARSGEHTKGGR